MGQGPGPSLRYMWSVRSKPPVPSWVLSLRREHTLVTILWAGHPSPHRLCPEREGSNYKCPMSAPEEVLPSATQPTHNEDGDKAGQRRAPVSVARGCCLAHQNAVEDEVSQAKLYTPCGEKRTWPLSNPTDRKPQQEAGKRN